MKKQYHIQHKYNPECIITCYHNGVKVAEEKCTQFDAEEYIEELEECGYTKGFTRAEVILAEKTYKRRLANIIEEV